jgi:hypothetical protein
MTSLLLLPSPLVGTATWAPVAATLRGAGHDVVVAHPDSPLRPAAALERYVAAAPDGPVVLVPHSNAGLYVPALAERLDVAATVFVDAALAGAGPDTAMAPQAMLEMLRGLTDPDGMLPPWSRWWPADSLEGLFPDDATRTAVEQQQPRLPLSYFTARLPVPAGWADRPAAYLAFGDTYADEVAFARQRGWPVQVLPGRHLHLLHDPDAVATAILDVLVAVETSAA